MTLQSCGLVLAFLLAGVCVGAQELRNPSFEKEGEAPDRAESWNRWGQWINRESGWSPVRSGDCLIGYHHWEIKDSNSSGIWQDIENVSPGRRYTFRVYANADVAARKAKDGGKVELRLESTVDGKQVTINSAEFPFESLAIGRKWSPLQVSGTAPNDTLRVLVVVHPAQDGPRDGAIKFDDATLTRE